MIAVMHRIPKRFSSTRILQAALFAVIVGILPAVTVHGRKPDGHVSLAYIDHSSRKIEQINGDYDWEYAAQGILLPTASQTVSRYDILGDGHGYSFEHNGLLYFLFGDTIGCSPYWMQHLPFGCAGPSVDWRAHDPIAWSSTTDPNDSLLLNYIQRADGDPLFVEPTPLNGQHIDMGGGEIPNSGISLNDQIYIIVNTGTDNTLANPHAADYSVLVRFDEQAQTFTSLRKVSALNPNLDPMNAKQGRFIMTSLHDLPQGDGDQEPGVLMFGAGQYRASNIYLSLTPRSDFEKGSATRYFTGLNGGGNPQWSHNESDAVPIVVDDPMHNGSAPTIGKLSVSYSSDLRLWLMTFDGGRQSNATEGIYFCYAEAPWGPWSEPQLIFNACRDGGFGRFIHYHFDHANGSDCPDVQQDSGPDGPTVGWNPDADPPKLNNPPNTTRGHADGPLMIERFTRVHGDQLSIYYTMLTWNPYAVVRMRSDFRITRPCE
jgi:hypothetical protein